MEKELLNFESKVRVRALYSPRSGEAVKNQFDVQTPDGRFFQSYNTIICGKCGSNLVVNQFACFSNTTRRYLKVWLNIYFGERRGAELYEQIMSTDETRIELEEAV